MNTFLFILAFFVAQLINVVLGTIKNVITIKGTKQVAAIFSAINYGVNTFVIKSISDVDMWVAITVSMICNLIGVYVGLYITEKMRKEQLWKITVTVEAENFENLKKELKENNIDFITYKTSWEKYKVLDIFSKHKAKSKIIRNIFNNYNVKYTISANTQTL